MPNSRRVAWLLVGALVVVSVLAGTMLGAGMVLLSRATVAPAADVAASATATSTPTPRPTPTGALVTPTSVFRFGAASLTDSFDQPDKTLFRVGANDRAAYASGGGAYTITITSSNYIAWSPLRGTYTDGAIEVGATQQRGADKTTAGVLFRYQNEQNYYFFGVSGDGYYVLALLRDGVWTPLLDWSISPYVRLSGQANRLRVEMVGDRFRVYVNNTLLDETRDGTFRQGGVALAVNTFDRGDAHVAFDHFVLYQPK